MRNIRFFLVIILFCSSNWIFGQYAFNTFPKGQIINITEFAYNVIDIKGITYNQNSLHMKEFLFKDGLLHQEIFKTPDAVDNYITERKTTYVYDEKENLKESLTYDSNNIIIEKTTYTTNNKGFITLSNTFDNQNNMKQINLYTYNKRGILVKAVYMYGTPDEFVIDYTYNTKNLLDSIHITYKDGTQTHERYEYETFDIEYSWTEKKVFLNNEVKSSVQRIVKYI